MIAKFYNGLKKFFPLSLWPLSAVLKPCALYLRPLFSALKPCTFNLRPYTVNRVPFNHGFTLLELMIAMAIGSMVMAASYVFWKNSLEYQTEVEVRSQELRDMLYIRRTMQKDMMALMPESADSPAIKVTEDNELILRCKGRVEWAMNLGPEVSIKYRLPESSPETNFFRRASSAAGEFIPLFDLRVEQGLKDFHFDFFGNEGWDEPERIMSGSIKAIRFFFSWEHIGDWQIIMPVQDIGKI